MTVAKGVINKEWRWAQRPHHQKHKTGAPLLASMFAPPATTREPFEERVMKSPIYLNVGDELHWPSCMPSEDGTEFSLGADGSLLIKKQAAAKEEEEAEGDPVRQPLVTLIAADFGKPIRALEKRLMTSGKAVDVDLPGRMDGLKVPEGAGRDAGGSTILTVTEVGDVVSVAGGRAGDWRQFPNATVLLN